MFPTSSAIVPLTGYTRVVGVVPDGCRHAECSIRNISRRRVRGTKITWLPFSLNISRPNPVAPLPETGLPSGAAAVVTVKVLVSVPPRVAQSSCSTLSCLGRCLYLYKCCFIFISLQRCGACTRSRLAGRYSSSRHIPSYWICNSCCCKFFKIISPGSSIKLGAKSRHIRVYVSIVCSCNS